MVRVIRYSSVGVFLAGIFTTIVGCSNEDQIRALILFLLLLLTGGGGSGTEEAAPSPTGTLPIIDLFTASESFSVPCVDDVTSRSITATESAAYNIRQINSNGFFGDSGTNGDWWSSSSNAPYSWARFLYVHESVGHYVSNQSYGFSVRCMQDIE